MACWSVQPTSRDNPQNAAHYAQRARIYETLGDYERAIAELHKALALKPDFAAAYQLRGKVYSRFGQREQAIADLEKALSLDLDLEDRPAAKALLETLKR